MTETLKDSGTFARKKKKEGTLRGFFGAAKLQLFLIISLDY
jgi:hypothetical protein